MRLGVVIMNEVALLVESVKHKMQEIAKQASTLGNGLLNAAPGEKADTPNASVTYLLTIAETINKTTSEIDKLSK